MAVAITMIAWVVAPTAVELEMHSCLCMTAWWAIPEGFLNAYFLIRLTKIKNNVFDEFSLIYTFCETFDTAILF